MTEAQHQLNSVRMTRSIPTALPGISVSDLPVGRDQWHEDEAESRNEKQNFHFSDDQKQFRNFVVSVFVSVFSGPKSLFSETLKRK